MAFSTIPFLFAFLPAALILYRIVPERVRAIVLILLSLVFYAWGDVRHLPVLHLRRGLATTPILRQ